MSGDHASRRGEPDSGQRSLGRGTADDAAGRTALPPAEGVGDGIELARRWAGSRSGAWAGRGFHFQDAVGAWLLAKVEAGSIPQVVVVPEGFEDVSLEGETSLHVQAKSRAEHLGLFPASEAAGHILEAWEKQVDRGDAASRLVVVFERGVDGEEPSSDLSRTLAESSADGSRLLAILRSRGDERGVDVEALLSSATVLGISWDDVIGETVACLEARLDLPPGALHLVSRQLVVFFADAADDNAARTHEERRRLGRTEVAAEVGRVVGMIDVESLEAAVRDGVCEELDYGTGEVGDDVDRFYEGVATQPEHVASGLVVRRPDVIEEVLAGLDQQRAVVITGPSGVGKSAVLWTIPRERQGVVWFRVKRLAAEDVAAIVRLAHAFCVSPAVPVGFLVDSAGTGDFAGWARLRAEAAAVPGMLLVATARIEDLASLGGLADCATVTVRLDEQAAETVHSGLFRRGATEVAHWREAFEQSGGLTLEFVHLLTRGRHLRDVIDDQVTRRVVEERHRELEVLALVSAADSWSAAVSTADIARACGLSDFELRSALQRLNDEHLVVERDGWVGGLHRLRSAAIRQAVHDSPPPTVDATIKKMIPLVPVAQLHRFLAAMLVDNPSARSFVVDTAGDEVLDLERLAASIQGLRLADFHQQAQNWNDIATRHGVPVTARPLLFMWAVGGIEPLDIFPDHMSGACDSIAALPELDSRGALLAELGWERVAELLASASDADQATQFLAVLAGCGPGLAAALAESAKGESPLASALRDAPLEALADCLAAAYDVDPSLARALVEIIGGEEAVILRIRADNPWLTMLEVRPGEGGPVGFARFLHVSDAFQANPEAEVHRLARSILRCLPEIESVDIQALLPGNHEITIEDYTSGVSRLSREKYNDATPAVAWRQARIRAAGALVGETHTARLTAAPALLEETAELTHQIGTTLVTGKQPTADFPKRRAALVEAGRALRPPLRGSQLGDTAIVETRAPVLRDAVSGTIIDIADNMIPRLGRPNHYRALAAFISDTIISNDISRAINEPWHLVEIETHPLSLDKLRSDLEDLRDVLQYLARDGADRSKIRRAALAGIADHSLRRAAAVCRRAEESRRRRRRAAIQHTCEGTGLRAEVYDAAHGPGVLSEYRIAIALESIFHWDHAVDTLAAALRADQLVDETYLLVPLRRDRPIPRHAMRQINHVHLAADPDGLEELPKAHSSTLVDIFDQANIALRGLSGIAELPDEQQDHDQVDTIAEELVAELREAGEKLSRLPDDPVTEALGSLINEIATRVQMELDGTTTEPGFASQIGKYLAGEISDELAVICNARYFAIEWDIDPQAAAEQFAQVSD